MAALLEATDASLLDRLLGEHGIGARLLAGDGLASLSGLSPYALARRGRLSREQAILVFAAVQLGARLVTASLREREQMASLMDAAAWATATIGELRHEEIWVMGLDGNLGVRGARRVSQGGLHGATTDVSTVLRHVIELGATAFVLAHNHPSGDLTPSEEDVSLTEGVMEGARVIRAHLLEHVIVAPGGRFMQLIPTSSPWYADEHAEGPSAAEAARRGPPVS